MEGCEMSCNGDGIDRFVVLRNRYLNTIEAALTGTLIGDPSIDHWSGPLYDVRQRVLGRDWPAFAQTMIGTARMRNLRQICEMVLQNEIEGDLIEAGVWRGGACIYMKAILAAYNDRRRKVFVADSFQGLPPPDALHYPADAGDKHHTYPQLKVSKQEVERNFRRYGLLDERVVFLEGWFKDTLAAAPIQRLSVLRLDGDMYESTIQSLDALYHKVSPGGAIIIDDYFLAKCAAAVNDFRSQHKIEEPLLPIDGWGVWWQRGMIL
jgi:O-methyltransferase